MFRPVGVDVAGPEIVEGCVQIIHCGENVFLTLEIRRLEQMRELVVFMACIEGCDKVCEYAATGNLAEGAKGTFAREVQRGAHRGSLFWGERGGVFKDSFIF